MTRSEQLFERAKKVLPGGVNSPVRAFRAVGGLSLIHIWWHAYRQALPVIAQIKDTALDRLHFDHAYGDLYRDGDMDGLMELAVGKTVDLLLGGMKELVDAGRLEVCLAHMRKGSGR